jgi:hypothetical protein
MQETIISTLPYYALPAATEAVKKSICSGGVSDGRSPMDSIGVQKSDPTAAPEFQALRR